MEEKNQITRREFLIGGGVIAASTYGAASARWAPAQMAHPPPVEPAPPLLDLERMQAFVDPLRSRDRKGIRRPRRLFRQIAGSFLQNSHSRVSLQSSPRCLTNSLLGLWQQLYRGSTDRSLESGGGRFCRVEWQNRLPATTFSCQIDHNLMGAEKRPARITRP